MLEETVNKIRVVCSFLNIIEQRKREKHRKEERNKKDDKEIKGEREGCSKRL